MRLFHSIIAGLCMMFFFCFAVMAWSTEMTDPVKAAYSALGDEAVVTKIESGNVTLQSINDNGKECLLSAQYGGDVHVGDKVKIDSTGIRKMDSPASSEPGKEMSKEPQSVEQPASTLDQNPKPGTHP